MSAGPFAHGSLIYGQGGNRVHLVELVASGNDTSRPHTPDNRGRYVAYCGRVAPSPPWQGDDTFARHLAGRTDPPGMCSKCESRHADLTDPNRQEATTHDVTDRARPATARRTPAFTPSTWANAPRR